jgi:DNA-binding XRE family transcriptional regulator
MSEDVWGGPMTAAEVKAVREGANLNASEFARAMGVTPQAIHQWEDGRTTPRGFAALAVRVFSEAQAMPERKEEVRRGLWNLQYRAMNVPGEALWLEKTGGGLVALVADLAAFVLKKGQGERADRKAVESERREREIHAGARAKAKAGKKPARASGKGKGPRGSKSAAGTRQRGGKRAPA